jgi:hypothetical protein
MTQSEYQRTIKRLGLSIVGAGEVIGVGPRQAQRFAHGDSAVPEPVARLLRLMIKNGITADEVKDLASREWLERRRRL